MINNTFLDTDAYKITHWMQRPMNLNKFHSYGEPRVGGQHDKVTFFGLQYILQNYFTHTQGNLEEAQIFSKGVFGADYFPKDIWKKVRDLGYLPLEISAIPEGTIVNTGCSCFSIENTEPWFAPMVSHFEDYLMQVWYPTAVATRGTIIYQGMKPLFDKSCDVKPEWFVQDFGLRGCSTMETAILGGMAHLLNFRSTDNLPALYNLQNTYKADHNYGSVWATEHSVATVWGKDREIEYVMAQLMRSDPSKIISIVIDSYDSDNFINNVIGNPAIVSIIKNRPGKVVLRPDSGDIWRNVSTYTEMLSDIFGFTVNKKGYKELNNVGVLQGDGMNERSIIDLYTKYVESGWAASNLVVGSGGGLLMEGLTRDTDRWAVKCSYAEIGGKPIDVMKSPKTDLSKASKAGKLLTYRTTDYETYSIKANERKHDMNDELLTRVVWRNGQCECLESMGTIKNRLSYGIRKEITTLSYLH